MSKRNRYNNGYVGADSLYTKSRGVISANKPNIRDIHTIPVTSQDTQWVRPAQWLPLPSLSANDQMFSGLFAIYPGASGNSGASADSNFVAFVLGVCGSNTNYLVDWGDGTAVQQYGSGVTAQYRYNFANIAANTQTPEGFRQVVIKAYPAVAGNTMALIDLQRRYVEPGVTFYRTTTPSGVLGVNWLDIKIAGAGVSLCRLAGGGPLTSTPSPSLRQVHLNSLKSFEWVGSSSISNCGSFFQDIPSLVQVVGTEWTSNAISTGSMFQNCYSLKNVPLLNTANSSIVIGMFANCYSLKTIPALNFSKVSSLVQTFFNCWSLETIPLLDTSNVGSIAYTFSSCRSLKTIPPLDFSKCNTANFAFENCTSLEYVPRLNFTSPSLSTLASMFSGCWSLQTVSEIDLPEVMPVGTSYSLISMFRYCYSLKNVPDVLNTKHASNIAAMFGDCWSLVNAPAMDLSKTNDSSGMFQNCRSLVSAPLKNTSGILNSSSMFQGCYSLQQVPEIDLKNATNCTSMFQDCVSLVSVPPLDLSKCTNTTSMFRNCPSLQNLPGITLNTSPTQTVNATNMFQDCSSLAQVPTMNTSRVSTMNTMFQGCYSLISAPVFDCSSTTSMANMFRLCTSLKTVGGFSGGSSCVQIGSMFDSCYSIETVPYIGCLTSNASLSGAFSDCVSLRSIGGFTASNTSSQSNIFNKCYNLAVGTLYGVRASIEYTDCNLSPTELNRIFSNLDTVSSKIISIGGNWGSFTCDRSIATAKGWTVSG